MKRLVFQQVCGFLLILGMFPFVCLVHAQSETADKNIYPVGTLKPRDSQTHLKIGDEAPDFSLPSVSGNRIFLHHYRHRKNVVLSFVPAAWTPVCTYQWPVYNLARDIFEDNDAILLGITVDNLPTLYAWTRTMAGDGPDFWFPVLSDFFPHGQVAKRYGILRSDGVSERAVFLIDKEGIIRYMDIHDINERPALMELAEALQKLNR
jgi:peroxiredoxin (alkyl hydroperoxide reductase subunit C)